MKKWSALGLSFLLSLLLSFGVLLPAQAETEAPVLSEEPVLVASEEPAALEEEPVLVEEEPALIEEPADAPALPEEEAPAEAPTLSISPWAVEAINEAQMMGLVSLGPDVTYGTDFTAPVTLENLQSLSDNFHAKMEATGLSLDARFQYADVAQDSTRRSVVFRVYNDAAPYAKNSDQEALDYLVDNDILKGRAADDYALDAVASYEEAITFYTRAMADLYGDYELGGKGYLYKVEHKENTAYLFASIHIGDSSMYPLDSEVMDAFHASDSLYVELNLMDPATLLEAASLSLKQDGSTLADEIGPEMYGRIKAVMDEFGVPEESYSKSEGWSMLNTLQSMPYLLNDPYATSRGIDLYFLSLANLQGKPIVPLETAEQQMTILEKYYAANHEELMESLDKVLAVFEHKNDFSDAVAELKHMQDAWTAGDAEAMLEIFASDPSSEILLVDRDPLMAERIIALLEADEANTGFVVVGAGHYLPEGSVLHYLEEAGFEVQALN